MIPRALFNRPLWAAGRWPVGADQKALFQKTTDSEICKILQDAVCYRSSIGTD
jgi:DNA primase